MSGLGKNVSTEFNMRARMNGFTSIQGTPLQLWYFDLNSSNSGFMGDRFLPSAHLEMIQGEMTSITLQNQSNMDHTIHLHGLDVDQANDGVSTTSAAVPPFGSFTYQFIAPFAGTYHYHCHIDTTLHYHKGMSGAIIVRPPGGQTKLAWEGGPVFQKEVLWHLNTYDSSWEVQNTGPTTARHRPDIFLLNGRVSEDAQQCPHTILRTFANRTLYLRVLSQSFQYARFSLGGHPFTIVASDGRPLPSPITTDSWELGTGERYDVLFQPTKPMQGLATVDYLDDYSGKVLGQVSTIIDVRQSLLQPRDNF